MINLKWELEEIVLGGDQENHGQVIDEIRTMTLGMEEEENLD